MIKSQAECVAERLHFHCRQNSQN